jgi:hypothetical protein
MLLHSLQRPKSAALFPASSLEKSCPEASFKVAGDGQTGSKSLFNG